MAELSPPQLQKKIHIHLAKQTALGSVIYIILFIVLTLSIGINDTHPLAVALLGSLILSSGLGRLALKHFSQKLITNKFNLWQFLFFSNIACGSLSWGITCSYVILHYGLTMPSFAFLLTTAGIASGSILSFAPVFRLVALHLTLLLTPAIGALCFSSDRTTALTFSLSLSVYLFYLILQGKKICKAVYEDLRKNEIIKQQKEDIENERNKTLEALQTKERFLAMMSHEIRTPLNGILGASELIINEHKHPQLLEQAQIIHTSGSNLLSLFNDIMTFSEVEKHGLELQSNSFNIIECINDCIQQFSNITRRKGLSLDVHIAPNIPNVLIGDAPRIKQVLNNILENAVKFTEKGGIKLSITGDEQADRIFKMNFIISDTGVGIEELHHKHIFEDFSQRDDFHQGGIGLSVCKKICERMGGSIHIRSQLGKGSTFQFTLPLHMTNAKASNISSAASGPRHILLVEDQIPNQKITTAMLKKMGHTVDIAANGREAVLAVQKTQYQAILMDCMMPEMDGFEATQEIRKTHPNIPIIAVTANALDGDRDKCLRAGMNDYLAKPINMDSLKNILNKYLYGNDTRKSA